MKILLVRHGQSTQNVKSDVFKVMPDETIPLTEKGILEAKEVSQFLKKYIPMKEQKVNKSIMYISPYLRTVQTAAPIQDALKIKCYYNYNLREFNRGTFGKYSLEDCEKLFPEEFKKFKEELRSPNKFYARPPKGESAFDTFNRIQFLKSDLDKLDKLGYENVIIVSHCGTIKTILMHLIGYDAAWYANERNMTNCSVREILKNKNNFIDNGFVFKGYKQKSLNQ